MIPSSTLASGALSLEHDVNGSSRRAHQPVVCIGTLCPSREAAALPTGLRVLQISQRAPLRQSLCVVRGSLSFAAYRCSNGLLQIGRLLGTPSKSFELL